jgi:hypothetical protein
MTSERNISKIPVKSRHFNAPMVATLVPGLIEVKSPLHLFARSTTRLLVLTQGGPKSVEDVMNFISLQCFWHDTYW